MPARGIHEVSVVCPGFAVDCLETLEEIDIENREVFIARRRRALRVRAGPQRPRRRMRSCLADLIAQHCQGWTTSGHGSLPQTARGTSGLMGGAPLPLLGTFHEISLAVDDVRAAVEFYERLGFTQATTTDTYSHPYGVLTDGRLFIGLHQRRGPPPC